jgi:hypothetical protein
MSRSPFLAQFFERRPVLKPERVTLGTLTGTAAEKEVLDSDVGHALHTSYGKPASMLASTLAGTQTMTKTSESPDNDPASLALASTLASALAGTQTMPEGPKKPEISGDPDYATTGRGFLDARML